MTAKRTQHMIQAIAAAVIMVAGFVGLVRTPAAETDPSVWLTALTDDSYRFEMTQEASGSIAGQQAAAFSFKITGAYDAATKVSRSDIEIGAFGFNMECTYLSRGSDLIVGVHESRQPVLGKWVKADGEEALDSLDAGNLIEGLREKSAALFDDLKPSGKVAIDGVMTTRYEGEIAIQSLFEGSRLPGISSLPESIPVETFVDETGFPRRIAMSIAPDDGTAEGPAFEFKVTMDFLDFGKPVNIDLPAEADVKKVDIATATTACFPSEIGNFGGFSG